MKQNTIDIIISLFVASIVAVLTTFIVYAIGHLFASTSESFDMLTYFITCYAITTFSNEFSHLREKNKNESN